MNRSQSTINRVIDRWTNMNTIMRKHGTGLIRKTTTEEDENIVNYAMNSKFEIIESVRNAAAPQISKTTITRRLRERRARRFIAAKKIYLTPEMIEERFDYALEFSNWTNEMCDTIVFMDECSVQSHPNGTIRVTRLYGTRYEPENLDTVDSSGRVTIALHCWMSAHNLGTLTRIQGNLNALQYLDILRTEIPKINDRFEYGFWNLVHDRSPIHQARITRNFIASNGINDMCHPRKSPDLNGIENVFAAVKKFVSDRLRANRINRPRNCDELYLLVSE
ncbi:hypothetical protein B4U80_01873, partial [Leptotrombidium deliense]